MNDNKLHACSTLFLGLVAAFASQTAFATSIATYTFHADTTDCIAEQPGVCAVIHSSGLSGQFQVDLDALDASGSGLISWSDFVAFEADNGISNWGVTDLAAGGIAFWNGTPVDFGIHARPDYSQGWNWPEDGGGETLRIAGVGVDAGGGPARTGAGSEPGFYCPATDTWQFDEPTCSGGFVHVETYGIQATYGTPFLQTVPIPAAAVLFGSGLLGLTGIARKKTA